MNLKEIARRIPDYKAFLTIDEMAASTRQLAAEYPDLVRVKTAGYSRQGEPIELITIGEGEENALVFGGPHPNEPIGCMTIEFLTRYLCEHEDLRAELGYRWHFVKCIDPDSMRLNEGWFKGPFEPLHYHSNFYRPMMNEQPEMLFPFEYKTFKFDKPLPETLALKSAIDVLQPKFMFSLHNGEFGSVFYLMSRPRESLYPLLNEIPEWFGLGMDITGSMHATLTRLMYRASTRQSKQKTCTNTCWLPDWETRLRSSTWAGRATNTPRTSMERLP